MEFTTRMFRPLIFLATGISALAQQYTVTTVAGGAPPATPLAAASTSIGQPRKLLVQGNNLYFSAGNSVYKMDSSGTMTLIAGNSRAGFSGDGGPAVNAQLNSPGGMAFDSNGNLYIADSLNNRVRMVSPSGMISTFAGDGGVSVPGFWGDGGPAVNAQIHSPVAVRVDANGNVYIVASADNTIRMVDVYGNISIYAGEGYRGYYGDFGLNGSAGFANVAGITAPQDMWINSDGSVLIADTGNACIRKVAADGIISTISGTGNTAAIASGDGVATTLSMISPTGVTADSSGNIYVSELGTNRIRKIDTSGNITTAIGDGILGYAGDGGPANKVEMNQPTAVAIDGSGNIYFADSNNNRVRKLGGSNVTTVAGNGQLSHSGDGLAATLAQLNAPQGVAVDPSGNFYIADTVNNVVRKVGTNGVIANFAGNGSVGSSGDGSAANSAQLNGPQGVAVDSAGNVYIADSMNNKVRKVDTNGNISTFASSAQFNTPFGVTVDSTGNVYVAEFVGNRVRKVTSDGATVTTIAGTGTAGYAGDGGPATSAMLNGPRGVAIDSVGNVYIADSANNRVRKLSSPNNGVFRIDTIAGNGIAGYDTDGVLATSTQVGNPTGVAVDSIGNLYIADGSLRIRKVFLSGIINTIAGSANRGYAGDGSLATNASLNSPTALAINSAGTLWFTDTNNNAVRQLQATGSGITAAALTNGATNQVGAISPGEVIVIYGSGIGPTQLVTYQPGSGGQVPTSTGGTSVFFNGSAAPVLYSSATQVAALVPYNISGSLAQMYVQYQSQTSAPLNLSVATMTPAVFTLNGSGSGQAAAINNTDGSINGPAKPAKAGDYVQVYITGVGQTNPPGVDGSINAVPLPQVQTTVTATVAGKAANVNYAGGAPGLVAGVIQVNVQIPSGVSAGGAVPLVLTVGTSNTQSGVTIAVTN
jgi:uncharacterized protein (TIGR03437 family)